MKLQWKSERKQDQCLIHSKNSANVCLTEWSINMDFSDNFIRNTYSIKQMLSLKHQKSRGNKHKLDERGNVIALIFCFSKHLVTPANPQRLPQCPLYQNNVSVNLQLRDLLNTNLTCDHVLHKAQASTRAAPGRAQAGRPWALPWPVMGGNATPSSLGFFICYVRALDSGGGLQGAFLL